MVCKASTATSMKFALQVEEKLETKCYPRIL